MPSQLQLDIDPINSTKTQIDLSKIKIFEYHPHKQPSKCRSHRLSSSSPPCWAPQPRSTCSSLSLSSISISSLPSSPHPPLPTPLSLPTSLPQLPTNPASQAPAPQSPNPPAATAAPTATRTEPPRRHSASPTAWIPASRSRTRITGTVFANAYVNLAFSQSFLPPCHTLPLPPAPKKTHV